MRPRGTPTQAGPPPGAGKPVAGGGGVQRWQRRVVMEILSSARHQGPQRRGASPGTLPHGGAGTDDVRHLAGTGTSPAAEHRREGPSWHVAKKPTAHGQRGRQKP